MKAIAPPYFIENRKQLVFLFMIFLSVSLIGNSQFQPTPVKKSDNHITINGKNFFLHEVVKGHTLFSIAKEYHVSEEDIKKINPELATKGISPGMVIKIPEMEIAVIAAKTKELPKFLSHTVLPKETFFSLSRQYGIKVDEIREANPEAASGLKIGMIVKIPTEKAPNASKDPVVTDNSTRNISSAAVNDSPNANDDQPCKAKPFPHVNDNFHLAVMLPLNLTQNDTLDYSDTLKTEHFRFYEFLEGLYLAIDSMRMQGLNCTVEVFDTERNPETIRGILESGKIKDADLIIGPIFPNEVEIVTTYSKNKKIPMVSPLSTYDVTKENPFAFQVRNKLIKQVELVTAYLGSKYNQNVVLIGRISEKDSEEFKRFTGLLGPQLKEQDPAKKATFKTIFFDESSRIFLTSDSKEIQLENYLSESLTNYLIVQSEFEVFVTELINKLQQKSTNHEIRVFGLNQWVFNELDLGNLYNVNLELYSDFEDENPFVDYAEPSVIHFCRKYKENWNIEPSKYSFLGFDITYFFTSALFQFGKNLTPTVPCWPEYLGNLPMINSMRFQSNGNNNGFGNQALTVVRYQKEELVRKKIN